MADTTSEVAQRLYVSGPSYLEVRPLLDGLKRRGADPYVLSDVAPLGAGIVQSLRLAISQADRVLIVVLFGGLGHRRRLSCEGPRHA